MLHLSLLFFFFALLTGCIVIGIYTFLYIKYRLDLVGFYLAQHIGYTVFVFLQSLSMYGFINTGFFSEIFSTYKLHAVLSLYFIGPMIYYQGRFFFLLAGVEWTPKIRYSIFATALYPVITATLILTEFFKKLIPETALPLGFFNKAVVFSSMGAWFAAYALYYIVLFRRYRQIGNPLYKFIATIFLVTPLFFLPLGLIDGYFQSVQIRAGQYVMGILAQPVIYLCTTLLALLVLYKAKKTIETNQSKISHLFFIKHNITEREKEIIEMLRMGLSNKEIASQLFLSPNTVRNHISNIFEKTRTTTRGKLINLLNQP